MLIHKKTSFVRCGILRVIHPFVPIETSENIRIRVRRVIDSNFLLSICRYSINLSSTNNCSRLVDYYWILHVRGDSSRPRYTGSSGTISRSRLIWSTGASYHTSGVSILPKSSQMMIL